MNDARLRTVSEYLDLGEIEWGYTELHEGKVLLSPNGSAAHQIASAELGFQLRSQLPADFHVIPRIDIDLELVPSSAPGFSRRPDLVVVPKAAVTRTSRVGGVIRAAEVMLVVEVVAPDSRRTDYNVKRDEYADAGIPFYWIVDVTVPEQVSLTALRLTESRYQEAPAVAGALEPFSLKIRVDQLV
ncbi:Uma2 family endonuclease [Lentzea sp. NPDC051213]|uniref:Uma2 family endonuclease n=1 Tax=Lentzea sp. NPDC051213 TaxID=3364126 RepID=UPI0037B0E1B5